MGVWSPRETLDGVLFLASSLMELSPSTGTCFPQEQRVFQENPVTGVWAGATLVVSGLRPCCWGTLPRGRGARGARTPALGAPGGTPSPHGHRAQSPHFWEGSWLLSTQESTGPVGSQEDVCGDGRTAVFLDVKPAAPGNPHIFLSASAWWSPGVQAILKVLSPDGRGLRSERNSDLRAPCVGLGESQCWKRVLDHWAGGGQCEFWACGLIEALRSSAGAWTLQVPRHCNCPPTASSCARPLWWFPVQGELRRETTESEKER